MWGALFGVACFALTVFLFTGLWLEMTKRDRSAAVLFVMARVAFVAALIAGGIWLVEGLNNG